MTCQSCDINFLEAALKFYTQNKVGKTALLIAFEVYRLNDRSEFVFIVNAQSTVALHLTQTEKAIIS